MGPVLRRRLGGVAWAVGVVVALVWAGARERWTVVAPGLGQAPSMTVAAAEAGRIATLAVGLHDPVAPGDVLATLDASDLEAERAALEAELLELAEAPVVDPRDLLRHTLDATARARASAELTEVRALLGELQRLATRGEATEREVLELQARYDELADRLLRNQAVPIEPVSEWAVLAAKRRVDAAEARVRARTLRSALQGQVTQLFRSVGDVVAPGEPIAVVEPPIAVEVIAWLPATRVPSPGTAAIVERADGSRLRGQVVSVGAGPVTLPEQVWAIPGVPQYGVSVRLQLEGGASVRPREPVRVLL